jgi:hypothetical protein
MRPLRGAVIASMLMLVGCEPAIDRGTTPKPQASTAPTQQGGSGVSRGPSQSHLGRARDAARNVADRVERQQQQVVEQAENFEDAGGE